MAYVKLTRHLYEFFPQLEHREIVLEAADVSEVVRELEAIAPGIAFYICDERGRLRTHVNVFIEDEMILDRQHLSDRLQPGSHVLIVQALSGG